MRTIKELDAEMDEFFNGKKRCAVTHPSDGAVAIIQVGDCRSVVQSVRIYSQTHFKGSYGVCFGSCDQLPILIVDRVLEKHFEGIDGAYDYITETAEKINTFFNSLA